MSNPTEAAPDMQPLVAVIILNWNGLPDTLACLQSLRSSTYDNVRIFVMDNGSREDPSSALASCPEVTLLCSPVNLGFTGGNNYAAEIALREKPDYLLVLNNDTIVSPEMICELVRAQQRAPKAGLISACQPLCDDLDIPGALGGTWQPLICRSRRARGNPDKEMPDLVEFDTLLGFALLVPRAIVEQVGLFDDQFFAYSEDTDLSLRVKQAGYRNYCAMKATVTHKWAGSTPDTASGPNCGRMYLLCRSLGLMIRKHARGWARLVAPLWLLKSALGSALRAILKPTIRRASAAELCGFRDGWGRRPPDLRWLERK